MYYHKNIAILIQRSGIWKKKIIKCKIKLRLDIVFIVKCNKLLNVVEVGLRIRSVIKIFVKLFFLIKLLMLNSVHVHLEDLLKASSFSANNNIFNITSIENCPLPLTV